MKINTNKIKPFYFIAQNNQIEDDKLIILVSTRSWNKNDYY